MILQTGQRTDIPAFYGQWLINRIRQGFVDVRNPYNPMQITRYPINHEVVDGIAFCTKNPLPFIPLLHEINDYRPVSYTHLDVYKRQGKYKLQDSLNWLKIIHLLVLFKVVK